jgi:two-component system, cell cycle sensor histidine kinase and response regulator CckA
MQNDRDYSRLEKFVADVRIRLVLVIATIVIFAIVFPFAYIHFGVNAGALITVVVLISSIFLGVKGGLAIWALSIPLYIIEVSALGGDGLKEATNSWPGIIGTLILTILIGGIKSIIVAVWRRYQSKLSLYNDRLKKINDCFLTLEQDTSENLCRLTKLAGGILDADFVLYARKEKGAIESEGFLLKTNRDFSIQLADADFWHRLTSARADEVIMLQDPWSGIARKVQDPVAGRQFRTTIGKAVCVGAENTGSLWLMFDQHTDIGAAEKDILSIIASAIAVEEKRKLVDDKRRENEEMFRIAFDYAPTGMSILEPKRFSYMAVNPLLCEMFGYTQEELMGNTIQIVTHPDDVERSNEWISMKIKDEPCAPYIEKRYIHKDGHVVWGLVKSHWIRDDEGVPRMAISHILDITQRKLAEEVLHASEELHRTLVSAIPDLIIRTELTGNIVFVNKAVLPSLKSLSNDHLIGRNIFTLIAEEDVPRARENTEQLLQGQLDSQEYRLKSESGAAVVCEVNAEVLRHNDGSPIGFVYIVRELTEKKRLQTQLIESQKMEAVGRLAGGMAHDYNNMLSVILGYAAILEKEIPESSSSARKIKAIIAAADRSANLTKQLLAFSRQQIIAPVSFNINTELATLDKMLTRLIGEDVVLVMHLQEGLWNIRIDPTQFVQVMTNLAANARDAIVNTGTVTVTTENVMIRESFVAGQFELPRGEYVLLTVADSGSGMDAGTQAHIFEPFFTTKPKDKGTGLGLATVFGIVSQNNGSIGVESSPGHGSTFRIYFPRCDADTETVPEKEEDLPLTGSETVLIVEDETELLGLIEDTLRGNGYTVFSADSPAAALDLVGRAEQAIDMLVTDVVMPGMNGNELKALLEQKYPALRTLFISGYTPDTVANRGVLESGMYFLQKPFTAKALLRKLREIVAVR